MDTYRLWIKKYEINPNEKDLIVDWTSVDDPRQPQNWTLKKRFACTALLSFISFLVTFASSIGSGTYLAVSKSYGVTYEVAEMTTSLFLVGFAIGAPLFAPLCEEFGRLPIYIVSMFLFSCFEIGAAVSNNMAALAICRFFAGFFGTSPLSNAGGSIADMWDIKWRTITFPMFGVSGFLGPSTGPIIGSYITQNVEWRWCHYVVSIFGFFSTILVTLFMPETYAPMIMDLKASSIRHRTGNKDYKSAHEMQRKGMSPFSISILVRPLIYAVTEPIVASVTVAISISYIVLFSHFESFPIIYETWGFSAAKSTLPFIAVSIGILFTYGGVNVCYYYYLRSLVRRKGGYENLEPEVRLIPLMICSWFIPLSLFWLAWTSYRSISPWSAIVSGFFFGTGLMQVFITSYMYLIDSYGVNSASALATLTLVRYNVSAGMVHITKPMYDNLGIHWAASLLGFLSLLICLVPFIFWKFGPTLRRLSPVANTG